MECLVPRQDQRCRVDRVRLTEHLLHAGRDWSKPAVRNSRKGRQVHRQAMVYNGPARKTCSFRAKYLGRAKIK